MKNGSSYSENQGYWDTCPDVGITSLHLTLPFAVKKRNPDGSVENLDPSTVEIAGYEAYYFANQATAIALSLQGGVAHAYPGTPQFDRQVMAGIDYTHNFVAYVEVDKRGNVIFKRYTVDAFMEKFKVNTDTLRRGL